MTAPNSQAQVAPVGRIGRRLAIAATLLALLASLFGLLSIGIYDADAATAEMLRGYDLITAVLVVPALGVALWFADRGSLRGNLTVVGLLAYLTYTYAYYIFGTGFNDLFLLHAAVFSTSLFALIVSLASLDRKEVLASFPADTPVRAVAVILALLAVALGGLWIFWAVSAGLTGEVPPGSSLVETDLIVHLGIALDLAILVPTYLAAAVLLWRREAWGYILAAIVLVSGALHQVTYMVALAFQFSSGIPESVAFDPAEPIILALYVVAAVLLLKGVRGSTTRAADRNPTRLPASR